MRPVLILILLATSSTANCQDPSISTIIKEIDKSVNKINNQKKILLSRCDSIADFYGKKVYKCWNYYFTDTTQKDVCKIAISWNGFAEWLYYYDKNKVIKSQRNRLLHGKEQMKWSIYFKEDKEIYIKGYMDRIRGDEVEEAYYFLNSNFYR